MLCLLLLFAKPVVLSTDFKPDLPGERQRIENAGRAVTTTEARGNIPRIDAGIAVSRTLGIVLPDFSGPLWDCTIDFVSISALLPYISGDLAYKNNANLPAREQAITALPEVRTVSVTKLCH